MAGKKLTDPAIPLITNLSGNELMTAVTPGVNGKTNPVAMLNYIGAQISQFIMVYDTSANWLSFNVTAPEGFILIESDTLTTLPKYKITDGITAYNDLPYAGIQSLSQLLNLSGGNTDGIPLTSPDGSSQLSILDGLIQLQRVNPLDAGEFSFVESQADYSQMLSYNSSGQSIVLTSAATGNKIESNIENIFTAPINNFGDIILTSGGANMIDNYTVSWGGGNAYLFGSHSGAGTFLEVMALYGSSGGFGGLIRKSGMDNYADNSVCYSKQLSNYYTGVFMKKAELYLDSFNETATLDSTNIVNIGTTDADIINIGNATAHVNILGISVGEYTGNAYVTDKLVTYNGGGALGSGIGAGFEIEENGVITGYVKTNAGRTGFSLKAPGNADVTHFVLSATAARTKTFQDTTGTVAENVNNLSFFAATTSAQLAANITNPTGLGLLVFNNNPTLIDPIVGTQAPNNNSPKAASTAYVDAGLALKQNINTFIDISATSTVVGWVSFTTKTIVYTYITPTLILVNFYIIGTSNATTASITIPMNSTASIAAQYGYIVGQNNGTSLSNGGRSQIGASANQVVFSTSGAGAAWNSIGTKLVSGSFLIMI